MREPVPRCDPVARRVAGQDGILNFERMNARLGASVVAPNTTQFRIWAPKPKKLELVVGNRVVPLARDDHGYAEATLEGIGPGTKYRYRLDGEKLRPDPAGALLPEGVHGPAEVVELAHAWRDSAWTPPALRDLVVYELHVGTFTREGTFAGVERAFGHLRELGVNAIELMPVAPFPGARNWGYDGVNLYAVQASYGGPKGLQQLVDAAHANGLAVILDVVFNHLGPEGNSYGELMPFFTPKHHTPWGDGINYDDAGSAGVRRFVVDAALRWFDTFHVDALRLDAVHGIVDSSAQHVLAQMSQELEAWRERSGRAGYLIAESDLGQSSVVRARPEGWGMDAQWSDDFHHALHARLTGERQSYYVDFGRTEQVATALRRGYVFEGEPSAFRKKPWGDSTQGVPPERFVVCAQNHDQVGNRGLGDRLGHLVDPARSRLAAALTLLSPHVPMLFQGEEYGAKQPFQYFTSHGDPGLAKAVSEGRAREFPEIAGAQVPDPQDPATFARSTLELNDRHDPAHAPLFALHQALIALRKAHPSLGCVEAEVSVDGDVVHVERHARGEKSVVRYAFDVKAPAGPLDGYTLELDTADARFGGPGAKGALQPFSAQVWIAKS